MDPESSDEKKWKFWLLELKLTFVVEEEDMPIMLGFGAMGVNLKVLPTFVDPMLSNLITFGAEIDIQLS